MQVPLTMPYTDVGCGRRPGPRAACAGSGCRRRRWPRSRRRRRARAAASKISSPCTASSALLAVTTSLPALDGAQDEAPRRLVAADQLDHDRRCRGRRRARRRRRRSGCRARSTPRSRVASRSAMRTRRSGTPSRSAIRAALLAQQLHHAGADRAEADQPDAARPLAAGPVAARLDAGAAQRSARMPRTAWRVRCSFSISAKRTQLVAVLAEADARRHRDLGLAQQELRELERAHGLGRARGSAPRRTSCLGLLDLPGARAGLGEAVDQHVAARLVRPRTALGTQSCGPFSAHDRRDLDRLEDAVVEVALDARQRVRSSRGCRRRSRRASRACCSSSRARRTRRRRPSRPAPAGSSAACSRRSTRSA